MGINSFKQKNRGYWSVEETVGCASNIDPTPPTCLFPAAPKAPAGETGRGCRRGQRVRRRKPLPLVPPPSWSLGEPAALRRSASHYGKALHTIGLGRGLAGKAGAEAGGVPPTKRRWASFSLDHLLNGAATSGSKKETQSGQSPAMSIPRPEGNGRSGMPPHPEFNHDRTTLRPEVPRGVTGRITGRF